MAWIESHQELAHHPKVARLAGKLDITVPTAIGHLHCLWWWCLAYAETGDVTDFDVYELAHAAQWAGDPGVFVKGLMESGWLDDSDGRTVVHDWYEYAGKLVERRRSDTERKRKTRAVVSDGRPSDIRGTSATTPDTVAPEVRADGVRTQPNPTNLTKPAAAVGDGFEVFHSGRAAAEASSQKRLGVKIRNVSAVAKAIAERPDFIEESHRLWNAELEKRRLDACHRCDSAGWLLDATGDTVEPMFRCDHKETP